ncbi:MAG: ABC-type dipeptide/oligopeptide/nickel transport system ATPase component [Verrucomicrobiales bacterium]|jgi:ABC-type dipeptide/oligopeptide/nickel transport system ATPase component
MNPATTTLESDAIFEISDLHLALGAGAFSQKPLPVLKGVSLQLAAGESVSLLGRTSTGKSVLLRALTRFFRDLPVRSVEGEILFEGENLLKLGQNKLRRIRGTKIAYILQNAHQLLNPQLTVAQHFDLLLKHNRADIKNRRDHAIDYLYQVGVVDPEAIITETVFPEELSTAIRQKIMIASALACEPRILVADEPTAEFDSGTVTHIVRLFEKLKRERGLAILVATGRVRRAEQFGDRIGILEDGRLVESAAPRELFDSGEHAATRAFVDGTLLAGAQRERLVAHVYI